MNSQARSGFVRSWVARVCLLAVLVAATVGSGHVCGALRAPQEASTGASQLQVAAGYCPICALAQPATPGPAPVALLPSRSATQVAPVPEVQPHSFQGLFALNVRPPPAA